MYVCMHVFASCGDKKVHRFKVADWKEASGWIRKLEVSDAHFKGIVGLMVVNLDPQQKREGWCKSAVRKQSHKKQQHTQASKTLCTMKPVSKPV